MDKDATIVFLDRLQFGSQEWLIQRASFRRFGVDDVGAIVDPKRNVRIVHIGRILSMRRGDPCIQ